VGAFRAKVTAMKAWRPESTPSNRDRLEIFALHKQAISGDAPAKDSPDASVADRAKMNAWRSKRGMTPAEAMATYCTECDRQFRVYGTAPDDEGVASSSFPPGGATPGGGFGRPGTPTNTPAAASSSADNGGGGGGSALLTPRGVAAVPLLCAAAAESRAAYLSRLCATGTPSNGWWSKQEPLCADPGTALAAPEGMIIWTASRVEWASLSLLTAGWAEAVPLPPRAVQAYLWPIHNVLLAVWIVVIFVSTLCGSAISMVRTTLIGAKRTGVPLDRLWSEEVLPASRAVASLCEPHQAIAVRLAGLALMPFGTICDVSRSTVDKGGVLAGTVVYVFAGILTWWYWLCCLPWVAFGGVCTAATIGWCFALIELAGM